MDEHLMDELLVDEAIARVSALVDAGCEAFLRGEFPSAQGLFDQAVTAADHIEAPPHHPDVLAVRAQALINRATTADRMGDHPAAVASFRAALALCEPLPEPAGPVLRASALVNLSQALLHTGDFDGGRGALEEARALLIAPDGGAPPPGSDTADLLIGCLVALTELTVQRERWSRAYELATESLDVVLRHRPELAGRPLMNLSAIALATGRLALAEDFAHQALTAFQESGTPAGTAEAQQALAQLYLRSGRTDEARSLLDAAQAFFERAGMSHQCGIGLDLLGLLAALEADHARAAELYVRGLDRFEKSGAPVAAAEVRVRLAAALHAAGLHGESEGQLALAQAAFAASGLGLRRAQTDYFHAALLENRLLSAPAPGPDSAAALLGRAVALAVPAALAIDAVRFTLANGSQRERWHQEIAAPAMRLAFRLAARAGAGALVSQLIESQCAGTPLVGGPAGGDGPAEDGAALEPPRFLEPLTFPNRAPDPAPAPAPNSAPDAPSTDTFRLGAALADVAADAGLLVAPPPRLVLDRTGAVALEPYIAEAETRYGGRIRDARKVRTW
ncbi:tetratricopeptide repeat protein [Streptomyces sp. NBC_01429]|uniref:tetratricopeptide repeat protein n=1 Tax=Streptomyces sp. NBC_01429 TaxID=2903862 RepID=UPI002E28D0A7|nr:tetratricopeptide repeat protein [Streptomyces sp. NBC_01429]